MTEPEKKFPHLKGDDDGPLAGWVIAFVGGRTLLGKYEFPKFGREELGSLNPVYDLNVQMIQTPQGLSRHFVVSPMLWLASLRSLMIPADGATIHMCALTHAERKLLEHGVLQADEIIRTMRAQEAGIMLAPADAKFTAPKGMLK